MRSKLTEITGILLSVTFIAGFVVLFIINPQTLEEINNVSLTFYNLEGMNGRMWTVYVIYSIVGLLNILFVALFIFSTENKPMTVVSKILFLITGILWLSFGLFPYDGGTDLGINLMLIRIGTIILTASVGLIILGAEFETVYRNKFMKWYTLSSGLLILLLSVVSLFLFDNTWMRTNASFAIYFFWFGVFGLVRLRRPVSVNFS